MDKQLAREWFWLLGFAGLSFALLDVTAPLFARYSSPVRNVVLTTILLYGIRIVIRVTHWAWHLAAPRPLVVVLDWASDVREAVLRSVFWRLALVVVGLATALALTVFVITTWRTPAPSAAIDPRLYDEAMKTLEEKYDHVVADMDAVQHLRTRTAQRP